LLFTSPVFLFLFLPLVLAGSLVVDRRLRPWMLLAASLFFYFWSEGYALLVLVAMIAVTWGTTRWIESARRPGWRRLALTVGLTSQLGVLAWFKYLAPFSAPLSAPLRALGVAADGRGLIHAPVGLSFFTFMAVTAVLEVYRRQANAARSPLSPALHLALFAHVTAGPIVRWQQFAPQVWGADPTLDAFAEGARRFIIGLAKKVLLAAPLGRVADQAFAATPGTLPASYAWLGLVAYTVQIYLDFSGYSDMAIGLGHLFGYTLPENFNLPYAARTVRDFWSRWHITLTSLLREFVFLPVAYLVSRKIRQDRVVGIRAESWAYHLAAAAAMLLCGVWHGAAWTFLAWGALHALALSLEQTVGLKRLRRAPGWAVHGWTLVVVMVGWVLFRAPSLPAAGGYFVSLLGLGRPDRLFDPWLWLAPDVVVSLGIGALVSLVRWSRLAPEGLRSGSLPAVAFLLRSGQTVLLGCLFLLSLAAVATGTFKAFIYFRF
jgi:alginate O-acetyltransferase complex protein AlgI